MERLFSYGTLQLTSVQLATFGRTLQGTAEVLRGFDKTMLQIGNADVVATSGEASHPIVRHTGDMNHSVAGTVFLITPEELQQADAYEVDDYARVSVMLASGVTAWVYVDARFTPPQ